jgi:hypothetical protein
VNELRNSNAWFVQTTLGLLAVVHLKRGRTDCSIDPRLPELERKEPMASSIHIIPRSALSLVEARSKTVCRYVFAVTIILVVGHHSKFNVGLMFKLPLNRISTIKVSQSSSNVSQQTRNGRIRHVEEEWCRLVPTMEDSIIDKLESLAGGQVLHIVINIHIVSKLLLPNTI